MKFVFKKYLEFEKAHGSEDTVDHVMQAARAYVESLTAADSEDEDDEVVGN
jgi:rRNA biogenesis protein RRP5